MINAEWKVVLTLVKKREALRVSKLCIILSNKCQKQNCFLRSYAKDTLTLFPNNPFKGGFICLKSGYNIGVFYLLQS